MSRHAKRESLHASVLLTPTAERCRLRRARRKAAARLHAEQRQAENAEAKARAEAEKAVRKATTYLPAAGEPGPAGLRTPRRLKLPRHRDTSATLAGAYPSLAEAGLGSEGVFIGQDMYSGGSFVFDPWVLYTRGVITAPNIVLAGIVGCHGTGQENDGGDPVEDRAQTFGVERSGRVARMEQHPEASGNAGTWLRA